jgi:Ca2+-binding EF-hand superfamily protein
MRFLAVSLAALTGFASASAQETAPSTPPAPEAPAAEASPAESAVNPDEMADFLNSQQQIRQGVTLTRSVDGQVVETKTETITYSPDDPLRGSEAGLSPLEALQAEFDSEALTRKEAYEEAKLDFVVADLNRDNKIDESEFVFLVNGWQEATVSGSGRGRFVDPTPHADEASAKAEHESQARAKFAFLAGGAATVSKKDYLREVLIDFDALDKNDDGILNGEELLYFRVANRGESITDQPAPAASDE